MQDEPDDREGRKKHAPLPEATAPLPSAAIRASVDRPKVSLIIKGGGAKGLAFVGALMELSSHYDFDEYMGTSAGAITATLLASGYTHEELSTILREKDFSVFKDGHWWSAPFRLLLHGGMYPGDTFESWIKELVAHKVQYVGDVPLNRLPFPVTLIACALGKGPVAFDSRVTDDNISAGFAVRASMAIPLLFTPKHLGDLRLVDGGLLENFPVQRFLLNNPQKEFVGLYLTGEPASPRTLYGWVPLAGVVLGVLSTIGVGDELSEVNKHRRRMVVIDPSPIRTTDFAVGPTEKELLIALGQAAALAHLQRAGTTVDAARLAAVEDRVRVLRARVLSTRRTTALRRLLAVVVILLLVVGSGLVAIYSLTLSEKSDAVPELPEIVIVPIEPLPEPEPERTEAPETMNSGPTTPQNSPKPALVANPAPPADSDLRIQTARWQPGGAIDFILRNRTSDDIAVTEVALKVVRDRQATMMGHLKSSASFFIDLRTANVGQTVSAPVAYVVKAHSFDRFLINTGTSRTLDVELVVTFNEGQSVIGNVARAAPTDDDQ